MGFLRPVAMVKIGILGLKDDRETVVNILHDQGVLQIEPVRKEALEILPAEKADDRQRAVANALLRVRGLLTALPRIPMNAPPRSWPNQASLLHDVSALPIDGEVGELKRQEDQLLTERKGLVDNLELLDRHSYYPDKLALLQGRHLIGLFGEGPIDAVAAFQQGIAREKEVTVLVGTTTKDATRFLAFIPVAAVDAVVRSAQATGIRLAAAPRLSGTIPEERPALISRRSAIDASLAALHQRLAEISAQWYAPLATLEEGLAIENRKFEPWIKMAAGSSVFALEGWVPQKSAAALHDALERSTSGRIEMYTIPTTDEPPTKFDNPAGINRFEFFIRFYSLPKGSEFDPTWIFAIAFPIFFGLMLADWGYGLAILIISLWMIQGFPGGQHLPTFLRTFVTRIMGPKGMQMLARTLVPGCLVAIVLGILDNEVFGFPLPYYTPFFDPQDNLAQLLVLSVYIGLVMVTLGFALGAVRSYYTNHRGMMQARIGGILLAWGIVFLGLQVVRRQFEFSALATDLWLVVGVAGVLCLLIGEGAQGLMGVTEVLSHILSYTRLIGILLSSVILAFVIDLVFWESIHQSNPAIAFFGVFILVVGQIFNLVLAVFEPGIQGARLIFVEHFSKYYEGNGRAYQPFGSSRLLTRPWIDAPPVTRPALTS